MNFKSIFYSDFRDKVIEKQNRLPKRETGSVVPFIFGCTSRIKNSPYYIGTKGVNFRGFLFFVSKIIIFMTVKKGVDSLVSVFQTLSDGAFVDIKNPRHVGISVSGII